MSGKTDDVKKCRECNAEIIWAITPKGKPTPLDAKKVRVAQLAETSPGDLKIEEVHEGHVSHWATCTNPGRFKKGAGK